MTPTPIHPLADRAAMQRTADAMPDVYARLVAVMLVSQPLEQLLSIWADGLPGVEPGPDAIAVLAERVAAPVRLALKKLRQQHGDHLDAIAQIEQVLALDPEHPDARIFTEAVQHLRGLHRSALRARERRAVRG